MAPPRRRREAINKDRTTRPTRQYTTAPALYLAGVARLEGFEPPTNGFGSHYSIRLSYRRLAGTRRATETLVARPGEAF